MKRMILKPNQQGIRILPIPLIAHCSYSICYAVSRDNTLNQSKKNHETGGQKYTHK